MRDGLNGDTVGEYRDPLKGGAKFPPLVVFFDGSDYWIGDGYHRWHAAGEAGFDSLSCDVRQGSRRDAVLYACSANSSHGLRRTNADKHKAVKTLLLDAEWVTWSDVVISDKCGVSHPFVGKLRTQLATVASSTGKRTGKDGKRRKAKRKPKKANPEEPAGTGDEWRCENCGGTVRAEDDDGTYCMSCKDSDPVAETPTSPPKDDTIG